MSKERNYRFYVKPVTPAANEAIADWLNARAESAGSLEHTSLVVAGEPVEGVFEVRHMLLTELLRSVHKHDVRVYVAEDGGQVRPYHLYNLKQGRLARTKAVKAVKAKFPRST
jgi:hypothetical protein